MRSHTTGAAVRGKRARTAEMRARQHTWCGGNPAARRAASLLAKAREPLASLLRGDDVPFLLVEGNRLDQDGFSSFAVACGTEYMRDVDQGLRDSCDVIATAFLRDRFVSKRNRLIEVRTCGEHTRLVALPRGRCAVQPRRRGEQRRRFVVPAL